MSEIKFYRIFDCDWGVCFYFCGHCKKDIAKRHNLPEDKLEEIDFNCIPKGRFINRACLLVNSNDFRKVPRFKP